jgi:glycosyltransferase involved in cell wall biosynthesis
MVSRPDTLEVEGFGMAYLEAGAAGRPSVAGNKGGSPEAVIHGETGLVVDPESVSETAEALVTMLRDPERLERMGQAACKRVLASFEDGAFLGRVKDACATAVDERRGRRIFGIRRPSPRDAGKAA